MLRKTLLTATAGVLISPLAMAADVATNTTSAFVSDEFLSTAVAASLITHPNVAFEIEAEYAVSDVIDLTFTGGALIPATLPSSISVACLAPRTGVTLGLLSATADEATYRVTELDTTCLGAAAGTTIGVVFNLCVAEVGAPNGAGSCDFNAAAVATAKGVTMSFSAQTSTGLPLDTGGGVDRSTALYVTGSQFAASVDPQFDGVIDVEQERERFVPVGIGDPGTIDLATYTVATDVVPTGAVPFLTATPVDQDITVAGDFGFLFDDDDTTPGLQPIPGVITWPDCLTVTYSATQIAGVDCTFGPSDITVDLTLNVDADGNNAVLDATSFVSSHTLYYTGIGAVAGSKAVTNVNLGAWTLNGFQAKVAYMPFQTGIGQVIYLANRGSQDGEITVDWIDQNGNSDSFSIGIIPAGSTRAIGPAINAGLPAAQREGGRLALVITANVPACDAQLNAQYNVSGDRAFSVATTNCSN